MRAEALEVLDTDSRIPYVRRRGEYLYNFWRDAGNPRGLWRRTTLDEYRTDDPDWDVLIDLDELSRADGENWVWAGADVIEPDLTLALISLSRGGSDATVVREFDMRTRQFVTDGFELPEAKTDITWQDCDTVIVGTDFGPGSLTESGYPRLTKRWRRGQPLAEAETLFAGDPSDVSVGAGFDPTPGFERLLVSRSFDFFNRERYELRGDELIKIDVPTDAGTSIHREWLLIRPRTDWAVGSTTHPAGSLLAAKYDEFLSGTGDLTVVFEPDEHTSLETYTWTRDRLVLVTLVDVDEPARARHPRHVAARADPRHPGQHQHGDRRRRRRTATRSSWTPAASTPRRGCSGVMPATRSSRSRAHRRSSTPPTSRSPSTSWRRRTAR